MSTPLSPVSKKPIMDLIAYFTQDLFNSCPVNHFFLHLHSAVYLMIVLHISALIGFPLSFPSGVPFGTSVPQFLSSELPEL